MVIWNSLNSDSFAKKLKSQIQRGMKYRDFISLYNVLMKDCENNSKNVAVIADQAAEFIRRRGLRREALLFDELSARAHIICGDIEQACTALLSLVDADKSDETREIAWEIVQDALRMMDAFGSSHDQIPRVLANAGAVLRKIERFEALANLYLEAAYLYGHHNAIQAAYRCTSDAEEIADELSNMALVAKTREMAATIACFEEDFEWAISAAESALAIFAQINEQPSPSLLSNLGLAQMRTGEYERALRDFKAAASLIDIDSPIRAPIALNMATCLRRCGDLDGAIRELEFAKERITDESPIDTWLELELVSARIASEQKRESDVVSSIDAAAGRLDDALADILRLHHRRGLRERYFPRFENLLREMPLRGAASEVIGAMALLRGNALGDWLVLLEWAEEVDSRIDIGGEHRAQLREIMLRLKRFGAPHLYGFWEKYDDPWEPGNDGGVWDELSQLAAELGRLEVPFPLTRARVSMTREYLARRLAEGHAFIVVTFGGKEPTLWTLFSDRYIATTLPYEIVFEWKKTQRRYGAGELDRGTFMRELQTVLQECSVLMEPSLAELSACEPKSIFYLPAFIDPLPISALVLANESIASQVANGTCRLLTSPAIHLSKSERSTLRTVVSMTRQDDDLLLARHEAMAFTNHSQLLLRSEVDVTDKEPLTALIGSSDVLVLSSHGYPLGRYADPFFAKMDENHAISVKNLQLMAADFRLQLVLLNSCHSASGSARNFQRTFRSSDAATFPALFLLNRQAVVSANLWRTSDTASFLYTCLVAEALRKGLSRTLALSTSVMTLRDLTKSRATELLQGIAEPAVRDAAIARLAPAPEHGAFSHPYLYGAVTIFSLL